MSKQKSLHEEQLRTKTQKLTGLLMQVADLQANDNAHKSELTALKANLKKVKQQKKDDQAIWKQLLADLDRLQKDKATLQKAHTALLQQFAQLQSANSNLQETQNLQ